MAYNTESPVKDPVLGLKHVVKSKIIVLNSLYLLYLCNIFTRPSLIIDFLHADIKISIPISNIYITLVHLGHNSAILINER